MRKPEYEPRLRRALKLSPEDRPFELDQKNEELKKAGKETIPWPPALPEGLEDFFDRADITLTSLCSRNGFSPEAQALLLFMYQEMVGLRKELAATDGASDINGIRKRLKEHGIPWRECMKYSKEDAVAKLVELDGAVEE